MKKLQGFTLIEISIVLVIIGLLAGGILKGQKMIDNAKYKAWVKEIDSYRTAVGAFQDRYKYLPGDLRGASSKLPVIGGVAQLDGNGDGKIDTVGGGWNVAAGNEGANAIMHLRAAGLIEGDATSLDSRVVSPIGGIMHYIVTHAELSSARANLLVYVGVPAASGKRLDEEFDDGKADSGKVVCYAGCMGTATWANDSANVNMFVHL